MSRIDVLKKHYEPRLEKFSDNSKVLDWENEDAQYKRFIAMTDNLDLSGRSILDVGCGCGDLSAWLKKQNIDADYSGVDILEQMVLRAKNSYPGVVFYCADIFDSEFNCESELCRESFDVTFASGIFNLNAGNNEKFLRKAVPVLASMSNEAFVFNLLDPSSPDKDNNYFYFEPDEAIALASVYAKKIELIQGYLDNDYTLICIK
ncbi:MAG: class I SAM-dependent methyltransferase [Spirochaetales bacterium]|nr:class I SAM-dependent methyltransferase [Spirochaetales bacterium]